jgi:tetratricopeptide (TPR) repeat protein
MYALSGDYTQAAERFEAGGDVEKAAQYYERAGSYYRAGKIHRQAGSLDRAIETLQRAERGAAEYREACALLGELFMERDQAGLARDRLKEATAGEPVSLGNLLPYFHLAVLDEKECGFADAIALFE